MSFFSWFKKASQKTKKQDTNFPNVVVGQITAIDAHPNASRLQLATVNVGKNLKIVCGAPNIAVGQYVPVAMIGACLANGMAIQQASIRGVDSEGMICAEDELGIGNDHTGIIVFEKACVGDPIDEYIKK